MSDVLIDAFLLGALCMLGMFAAAASIARAAREAIRRG